VFTVAVLRFRWTYDWLDLHDVQKRHMKLSICNPHVFIAWDSKGDQAPTDDHHFRMRQIVRFSRRKRKPMGLKRFMIEDRN